MRRLLLALLLTAATCTAQWQLQDSRTTADLRGIDNVGKGVAWASGSDGTILRTEDAGFVWQLCAKPPGGEHLDFRAIQAFDNNTAIVMSSGKGDLSRLYKTTDGCQTWTLLFTNPDPNGFWDAMQFAPSPNPGVPNPGAPPSPRERQGGVSRAVARESNHRFGWLVGDPVSDSISLFVTRDGGVHWTKQNNRGLAAKSSEQGVFAASNSTLLARGGFAAFATGGTGGAAIYFEISSPNCPGYCPPSDSNQDGSANKWLRVDVPVGSKTESSGIFSMNAKGFGHVDNSISVAVGGDYKKPDDPQGTAAYFDIDSKHWSAATTPPHGYRSAVAYDEKSKTWITVGPNGTDISTDDGRNWRALHPDPAFNEAPDADQHWNALSLPFVVGPHGRIGTLRPSALNLPAK